MTTRASPPNQTTHPGARCAARAEAHRVRVNAVRDGSSTSGSDVEGEVQQWSFDPHRAVVDRSNVTPTRRALDAGASTPGTSCSPHATRADALASPVHRRATHQPRSLLLSLLLSAPRSASPNTTLPSLETSSARVRVQPAVSTPRSDNCWEID